MKNVIHRDISLDNILFCYKTGEIKLIDFGISKKVENSNEDIYSPTTNMFI